MSLRVRPGLAAGSAGRSAPAAGAPGQTEAALFDHLCPVGRCVGGRWGDPVLLRHTDNVTHPG